MRTEERVAVEFDGRVVLVTGAAKRIGRAIALEFARCGCDVAIHCHASREEAARTARDIQNLGRRAVVLTADLADADATAALAEQTVSALGALHILINNASTFERMALEDFSRRDWNATL